MTCDDGFCQPKRVCSSTPIGEFSAQMLGILVFCVICLIAVLAQCLFLLLHTCNTISHKNSNYQFYTHKKTKNNKPKSVFPTNIGRRGALAIYIKLPAKLCFQGAHQKRAFYDVYLR